MAIIDRPHFYFTAEKVKKWLAIAILIFFVLMVVVTAINREIPIFFVVLFVLLVIAWIILWFIT